MHAKLRKKEYLVFKEEEAKTKGIQRIIDIHDHPKHTIREYLGKYFKIFIKVRS